MCQKIDAAARARDPRVAQVSVSLSGSWTVVEIVRADGFVATDVRPIGTIERVDRGCRTADRRESPVRITGSGWALSLRQACLTPRPWNGNMPLTRPLAQALTNLCGSSRGTGGRDDRACLDRVGPACLAA